MFACSLSSSPTPTDALEPEGGPEIIGSEVDSTPELDAAAAATKALASDGGYEGLSVYQETSVATNPNNKAADDAIVCSPENVADQVAVVVTGDDAALLVGTNIRGGGEPANTLPVDARGADGEREKFSLLAMREVERAVNFDPVAQESRRALRAR